LQQQVSRKAPPTLAGLSIDKLFNLIVFCCEYMHYASMTTITIRNVPEETHAELAARAALAGQSLQEYLRTKLVEVAERPEAQTLVARVRERKQATRIRLPAEKILSYRDSGRR
jgi:plasmid stability protein